MSDHPPSSGGVTSPSLLERLRSRDQEAWQRFVHIYGPMLRNWCRRVPLPADDLAGLCQEVFSRVAGAIGDFRPSGQRGAFRAWLRTITTNCLSEHLRRSARHPRAAGGSNAQLQMQETPDLREAPEEEVEVETVGVVQRALEMIQPEFTDPTWQAFSLVSLEDRPVAEVADQLGLSVHAVRQACYRVRRRLRLELRDLDD